MEATVPPATEEGWPESYNQFAQWAGSDDGAGGAGAAAGVEGAGGGGAATGDVEADLALVAAADDRAGGARGLHRVAGDRRFKDTGPSKGASGPVKARVI